MTQTAYIALGGNLGDSAETLRRALEMLNSREGLAVRRISQFIRTAPSGGPADQGVYLNAAAEIVTTLAPGELLAVMQQAEADLGRDRSSEPRWGPRTCDLDILMMGEVVMETEKLTIPHPRMHQRRFVLEPLAQIAPEAVHPILKKTAAQMLVELGD